MLTCTCLAADSNFYSRPCGRGDLLGWRAERNIGKISTHAPAGGATKLSSSESIACCHFYSRPCGRGDAPPFVRRQRASVISTHAPAGGATPMPLPPGRCGIFLLTPLREGRPACLRSWSSSRYFYSRPCGRGDGDRRRPRRRVADISTHAPAGGATDHVRQLVRAEAFLLTPLREGRPSSRSPCACTGLYFYSRPCGRGDAIISSSCSPHIQFLLTPLREGRQQFSTSPS